MMMAARSKTEENGTPNRSEKSAATPVYMPEHRNGRSVMARIRVSAINMKILKKNIDKEDNYEEGSLRNSFLTTDFMARLCRNRRKK